MTDASRYLDNAQDIARLAGAEILDVYHSSEALNIIEKSDNTPLTQADLRAHKVINEQLAALTPDIPILSEEAADISFDERSTWLRYWLVDPLDGTKEFIHRSDEFTVNIALIENHYPVLGVVYVPVMGIMYFAAAEQGAFRRVHDEAVERLAVTSEYQPVLRVAASRRHQSSRLQQVLGSLGEFELVPMGSALKICVVAEGGADLYPRLGPTSEWDTAAGQCVVEQAGGYLTDMDGNRFKYNCKDSLLNPPFLVFGDRRLYDDKIAQLDLTQLKL